MGPFKGEGRPFFSFYGGFGHFLSGFGTIFFLKLLGLFKKGSRGNFGAKRGYFKALPF